MTGFEVHGRRGPFNAAFFSVMGPYLEWNLRKHKRRVFADLPREVVGRGSGVGAKLRYLPPGATLVAIEPNPHVHRRLRAGAEHPHRRHRLRLTRDGGPLRPPDRRG